MKLIQTEKYQHQHRTFDIQVCRDTNNDFLVIEPEETTRGKK